MQTVKVNKNDLMAKLKANRASHHDLFLKAQEKYRQAAIEELDAMLAEARANKRIRRFVGLLAPIDQTKEYDRAISMLEMSVDDVVTITERDYQCYVLDQWDWSAHAGDTNKKYVAGLKQYDGTEEIV